MKRTERSTGLCMEWVVLLTGSDAISPSASSLGVFTSIAKLKSLNLIVMPVRCSTLMEEFFKNFDTKAGELWR